MRLKSNYWVRSGTYAMTQRIVAFVLGFGSYFFLVRYFSVKDFGIWTLYIVVSTSAEMSRSAFIQNAFVKFYNEKKVDKSTLFYSSLLLNALTTACFIILLVSISPVLQSFWNSQVIGKMILWYCVTSVVLVPFTQLNYLEQANHQFSGIFWSSATRQGTFFLIVVSAYLLKPGLSLIFFAAAHSFSALLGLVTAFLHAQKMLPVRKALDWSMVNKLFKFGKYILGTGITSTVGKNASHAILGSISHRMVAQYDAAVRIINFIEIPTLAISSIVYPKIAEQANKEGNTGVAFLYEQSVAIILGIILPIISLVALFPELFLTITAGKKYLDAAPALRLMALAAFLIPFIIQLGSAFEVINKPHISFRINLISSILNVLLTIILTFLFGFIGAAYAFSISLVITFLIGQVALRTQVGIQMTSILSKLIGFYRISFLKVINHRKKTS